MTTQATYRNFSGTAAENYERYFVPVIPAPLADDLVAAAALKPGERVVDVACGTGIVARLAAERVGPSGSVTGVDLSPEMLEVAQSLSTAASTAITWRQGSAEALPLEDGSVDVVLSQLGLMFVEGKAAAAAEMHRVLADGGRLTLNVPGELQPLMAHMDDAIAAHVNPDLAGFVGMVFSLHDERVLADLFGDAGFSDVDVSTYQKVFDLPAPRDFLWQYINCTPMSMFMAGVAPETMDALEADVVERWAPFTNGERMRYEQPIVTVSARR